MAAVPEQQTAGQMTVGITTDEHRGEKTSAEKSAGPRLSLRQRAKGGGSEM